MLLTCLHKNLREVGCDEAGRGCLAGPVSAAAVILPSDYENEELNDSKQLEASERARLRKIVERDSLDWAVAFVWPKEIDEINILNASFIAMHRSIDQLVIKPESIIVDGNRFIPYGEIPHTCIIKGDGKFMSIAAASILAKFYRDFLMEGLHSLCPEYNWEQNKGYPTLEHRKAIYEHGSSTFHRKSFKLLPNPKQLTIFDL